MAWYEKVNRLEELKECFTELIGDEIFKHIQYVSIRKTYKNWIALVGINDMEIETELLNFAPQIILKIKEFQLNKNDELERQRIPARIEVFKFDLSVVKERKEEKKKQKQLIEEWIKNPYNFAKDANKEDGFYSVLGMMFVVKNKKEFSVNKPFGCNNWFREIFAPAILNKQYSFKITDRYNKVWCYITDDKTFIKYKQGFDFSMHMSKNIEYLDLKLDNNAIIKISKNTYKKWELLSMKS